MKQPIMNNSAGFRTDFYALFQFIFVCPKTENK